MGLRCLHPLTPSIAKEQHLGPFPSRLWAVEAAQGAFVVAVVVHVHWKNGWLVVGLDELGMDFVGYHMISSNHPELITK